MKPRGKPPKAKQPLRREATVRLPWEVARRVREGHPWIFEEALRGRPLPSPADQTVDVLDPDGGFVGRALLDPGAKPALRVYARTPGRKLDAAHVRAAVDRALGLRLRLLQPGPESCYRLINGDSEGLPGTTVDRYGSYLVICQFCQAADRYLGLLLEALTDTVRPTSVYLQRRHTPAGGQGPRPGAELIHGPAAPPEVVVTEGRARFVVDVTAPAGTGLFPDMRLGRQAAASLSAGKRVINCFSYTGAFSVVAALGGAAAVTSVDSAARAHGRARRNFGENGLDAGDPAYTFVTGDALATLARLEQRKQLFDLVILDPPTFSGGKGRTFTAARDYGELMAAAVAVTAPRGVLCVASNAARLQAWELERSIARGASLAGRDAMIVRRLGQPPDYPYQPGFPEGNYLKFFIVQAD